MAFSIRRRPTTCLLYLACFVGLWNRPMNAQQIAGIQSATQRVFVTSVTPVIGPGGLVGGVLVDAEGVVSRPDGEELASLQATRAAALQRQPAEITRPTAMRMISLKRLDESLERLIDLRQSPPEAMMFLAGLQRIEYVFADPDEGDVVLAGPAEGWRLNETGQVVGETTGLPVLRLDDLMEALRTSREARAEGISCSIEPSEEGLRRYAQLLRGRRVKFDPQTVRAIEKAMGTQEVSVTGVEADSHYARVMVAADFIMKRLAMGFEPSNLRELPSYLQMLRRQPLQPRIASPRWWMTVNYDALAHSPDGLAWQIRGPGLMTMTEDSFLDAGGKRTETGRANPDAQRWADGMTKRFAELTIAFPVFGELRNCFDLSVVAALIAKRDLYGASNCQLNVLLDRSRVRGPRFEVPQTVDSRASFVKARQGWVVSVSGGVDVDAWAVVEKTRETDSLEATYLRALERDDRWWW